jgi:hypothetical protein
MKVLSDTGYRPGANMGNSWWSQPQILQAQQEFKNAVKASPNFAPFDKQGNRIDLPTSTLYNNAPFGDANKNGLGFAGKLLQYGLPVLGTLAAPYLAPLLNVGPATAGAIGGALGGAAGGGVSGGGFSGALKGAAMGGLGGYLTSGGFSDFTKGVSDLFNSTSLSTPFTEAARSATSSAATSAVPSSTSLSGFLPSAPAAGGGSSGGFFSQLFDAASPTAAAADELPWLKEVAAGTLKANASTAPLPWATEVAAGTLNANPYVPQPSILDTVKTGVTNMAKPSNIASGALKLGFSSLLQKDNDSGYTNIANAAKRGETNYQPFLDAGTEANKILADLSGVNGPEAARAALQAWQMDPSFTFARDEGIKALDASAAAKGMLLSGNQQQEIQKFGTGLAGQYFQQYLQNLMRQSDSGRAAAAGVNEGIMEAAMAEAAKKAAKANRFNQIVGGFASYL